MPIRVSRSSFVLTLQMKFASRVGALYLMKYFWLSPLCRYPWSWCGRGRVGTGRGGAGRGGRLGRAVRVTDDVGEEVTAALAPELSQARPDCRAALSAVLLWTHYSQPAQETSAQCRRDGHSGQPLLNHSGRTNKGH